MKITGCGVCGRPATFNNDTRCVRHQNMWVPPVATTNVGDKLLALKWDVEHIGEGWDYDMTTEGKIIDMQRILENVVAYLIERDMPL